LAEAPVSPKAPTSPKTPTSANGQVFLDARAVSSTAVPPPPVIKAEAPLYPDLSRVLIHGIGKKPELNEQIGLVMNFDGGADRRYTVKVLGTVVKLKENNLSIVPDGYEVPPAAEATGEYVDSVLAGLSFGNTGSSAGSAMPTAADAAKAAERARLMEEARRRDDANAEIIRGFPQGDLNPRGQLVPTYGWVQVPKVASLPPGMEIWMLGDMKAARIPSTWRLQVVTDDQADSYRTDVGEHTPVSDVIIGAAAKFGWDALRIELRGEGKPIELHETATVGDAGLFGRKLTVRRSV